MEKEESKNSIGEKSALVKLAWGELLRVRSCKGRLKEESKGMLKKTL